MPLLIVIAALLLGLTGRAAASDPERSVVQITTFSQQPVWDAPWRSDSVRRSSGTGFVVRGKRIMTNAHVVSWAKQILVRRYQDPRPYVAKVKFIGHDCDLALLEVENEEFFDGMQALEIGNLPPVRSTVATIGYPAGGEQISYTRGVVSRIEVQSYVHVGNRAYLAAQTDAAINPGNSGGPVIQDDKVVGVAFQGLPGLENTGFFIPTTLVNHFLTDVDDGEYNGFPQAGIRLMPLQNPAYRKMLKMPDNNLGTRIDHIFTAPASRKLLKLDDVLLKAGEYDVGSDGTILYHGNRVSVSVVFNEFQHGQPIHLKLWRDGAEMELDLPLEVISDDREEGNLYDVLPRYHVYGGLVFMPLCRDLMKSIGGNWTDPTNADLLYELFYRKHDKPETVRAEPIVLTSILTHRSNANFSLRGRLLVDKINGVKINCMEDVIKGFATENGTGQHVLEFYPEHGIECLDRKASSAAQSEILKSNGITNDRRL